MVIHLCTTLLDKVENPAAELVELYATRWEEELFFRELKSHLHGRGVHLDSFGNTTV
jgi:IS4 transposase